LARSLQCTELKSSASKTFSRARQGVLLLAAAILLVGFCSVFAGCGSELDQLSEEAVALMGSGRYDDALPIQERIAALDPDDAQIRVELGFNYLNHQNDPARSVAIFREAVDLEPSAKHLTFLAQAYLGSGDLASAEATLQRAIDADGSYGHAYAVLVSLLERQGRTAEATELRQVAKSAGVPLATDSGQ
jgi:tetratricopeptide (TPR) repeat protein